MRSQKDFCYFLISPIRATTIAVAIVGRVIDVWEAIQKKNMNQSLKQIKKSNKEVNENFCYHKVGNAIIKWEAILKIPIFYCNTGKNIF